jgi:DNA-binding HxlR family transcriptional regulator
MVTAEATIKALSNGICAKILYRLYKHGLTDIDTIMKTVDYAPRYRSKFLSRYLLRLQKRDLIEIKDDVCACAPTPIGVLTVDFLGKLKISEVGGKISCIKALREPKTNKQLQKELELSRTFCSILLRQLKDAGIVNTERVRYKIRDEVAIGTLQELPSYYSQIISALSNGNPEKITMTAEGIAEITGLTEKSVQARLSELSRMNIIEKAGPKPVPTEHFFALYYQLTEKGKKILETIDKFERLVHFVQIIESYTERKKVTVSEEELWRIASNQVGYSVNTFDLRKAINVLKNLRRIQGDKIAGYCKKEQIVHSEEPELFTAISE